MSVATQLVVIYSAKSKIFRRKIIPDNDAQLAVHQAGPGEARLLLAMADRHDDASCCAAIAAATGVHPPSSRCCIVDAAGNVVAVCNADPELDSHPAGQLISHEFAGPGDRYENGIFKRQYAIVNRASRRVIDIAYLALDDPAASDDNFFTEAGDRKLGDIVPDKARTPQPS